MYIFLNRSEIVSRSRNEHAKFTKHIILICSVKFGRLSIHWRSSLWKSGRDHNKSYWIEIIKIVELLKYVYYLWLVKVGDAASPSVRSITSSPATSGYHGGNKPIQHLASFGPTVTPSSGVYGKDRSTISDYSDQDNAVIIFVINIFLVYS